MDAHVVEVPGVGNVEFPDSMSMEDIGTAAARLYQQHVNEQLKAANAKPLSEPTTYEGGRNASLMQTVEGVGRGVKQSLQSLADPRTYLESAKAVADVPLLVTDPAGPAKDRMIARGGALVDEAKRVVSGDPEAGGRAISDLSIGLVAPRVASVVGDLTPGYIQRARARAAEIARDVQKSGSVVKAAEKAAAEKVLTAIDPNGRSNAVVGALRESLSQPTEMQPRLVRNAVAPAASVPDAPAAPTAAATAAPSATASLPAETQVILQALVKEGLTEQEALQAVDWLRQGVSPQAAWARIRGIRAAQKLTALGNLPSDSEVAAVVRAKNAKTTVAKGGTKSRPTGSGS
jgi:hypothetical protein